MQNAKLKMQKGRRRARFLFSTLHFPFFILHSLVASPATMVSCVLSQATRHGTRRASNPQLQSLLAAEGEYFYGSEET
jgi:hypothetical protein